MIENYSLTYFLYTDRNSQKKISILNNNVIVFENICSEKFTNFEMPKLILTYNKNIGIRRLHSFC